MDQSAVGTCSQAPAETLRWGIDPLTAKRIGCFNRHYAEHKTFFESVHQFTTELEADGGRQVIRFYDSVNPTRLLFRAPVGRSMQDFVSESRRHGWPSFRDEEVVWDNVRVLANGETVS